MEANCKIPLLLERAREFTKATEISIPHNIATCVYLSLDCHKQKQVYLPYWWADLVKD